MQLPESLNDITKYLSEDVDNSQVMVLLYQTLWWLNCFCPLPNMWLRSNKVSRFSRKSKIDRCFTGVLWWKLKIRKWTLRVKKKEKVSDDCQQHQESNVVIPPYPYFSRTCAGVKCEWRTCLGLYLLGGLSPLWMISTPLVSEARVKPSPRRAHPPPPSISSRYPHQHI